MSIEREWLDVGGISVEVVRKNIKNLHLGVYPPDGRVRMAIPHRLDQEDAKLAVITRLPWIKRKRDGFQEQDRQSEREMVTGESHYFEGRRYRLEVVESSEPPSISIRGNRTLELRIRPRTPAEKRRNLLNHWYRDRLRERVPGLIEKWEPVVGVSVSEWRLRRMRTKWGTCNREARRIWINSELAKKPPSCLEYILVHEMVHFIERNHTETFKEHMDRILPRWRTQRDELNAAPLSHEEWRY